MDAVDVANEPEKAGKNVAQLRELVEDFEARIVDGLTGGYYDPGTHLYLNTITIGIGLDNTSYEPDTFPAIVYHLDTGQPTVIIFENGHLSVIDADSADAAKRAITITVKRIADLGICQGDAPSDGEITVVNIDA